MKKTQSENNLIEHKATLTRRRGGKLIGGVYEVSIPGKGRKLLPLIKLKELSGVKRIDQHAKIDAWLNTEEGTKWALEVPAASVHS